MLTIDLRKQWATANLDTQITLLETFISSINATVTGEPVSPSATVSPEALQHYMSVKRNVVTTIRQVVEVVGKYAGGSLPEPAKQKVKGFILSLPGRWSVAVRDAGLGDGFENAAAAASPGGGQQDGDLVGGGASAGDASASTDAAVATTSATRLGSSSINPRKRHRLESSTQSVVSDTISSSNTTVVGSISAGSSSVNLAGTSSSSASTAVAPSPTPSTSTAAAPGAKRVLLPPTTGAARHAAHRVLTLAQESLHAVKNVTAVFKDTLDRAETYVHSLAHDGGHR
jgi:hypothetical protein